jgi:hypothetical protein
MSGVERPGARWRRVASWVVPFLALYQGVVPLVARPLFGRDQRFAVALALPAPWWWIACLGIIALAAVLLVLLHAPEDTAAAPEPDQPSPAAEEDKPGTEGYDALSAIVLLVGIYNGLAPFVSRLVFGGDLFLAFTLRLPPPWWWIASLAVLIVTGLLLGMIDRAKQRHAGAGERDG